MSLLRSFPIMVIALVLLSIVGFCAAAKSVQLLLIAVTLTALSWYVTEGPRGRTLPRWVSNVLVLAASLSVVVDLLFPPNDIAGVLGRFSIWLTLIKLYERRTARDHAHLMGLSLLLMIVGCLNTQEMLFGIVLMLYAVLGLYVLLLYQLYAAHETSTSVRLAVATGAAPGPPRGARSPIIGRHVGLHFRLLAGGIGVVGIGLSVILFLIFPRTLGRGLLSAYAQPPATVARVGYTDEINLGAGTRISSSRRPAFDLQLLDPDGRPVHIGRPLYLRGAVLDLYHDGQWQSAPGRERKRIQTDGEMPLPLGVSGTLPAGMLKQVFRSRGGTNTAFSLGVPASISTSGPQAFSYTPSRQTLRNAGRDLLWAYTVEAPIDPSDEVVADLAHGQMTAIAGAVRFADLSGEAGRRVRDLALALLDEAGVPPSPPRPEDRWSWNKEAALVFRDHLQGSPFEYTLDLSDVVRGNDDPIVHFLFESQRGHCEYYASALAAMCRMVGIDARVITGFVATEYDPEADRYIIRDANAHAWVEVRTGGFRYTVVDPTPAAIVAPRPAVELALGDRLGWIYERLEGGWTSRVVQFDARAQGELLASIDRGWSRRISGLLVGVQAWMARVNRAFYFGAAGYVWLGLVALAVVIALVAAVGRLRRYRRLRRTLQLRGVAGAESRRLLRQLGFYPDMLEILRRAGCPKPTWQPPLAFAGALRTRRPDAAAIVRSISELYYDARYARRRLAAEEIGQARRLVRELEPALRSPAERPAGTTSEAGP